MLAEPHPLCCIRDDQHLFCVDDLPSSPLHLSHGHCQCETGASHCILPSVPYGRHPNVLWMGNAGKSRKREGGHLEGFDGIILYTLNLISKNLALTLLLFLLESRDLLCSQPVLELMILPPQPLEDCNYRQASLA